MGKIQKIQLENIVILIIDELAFCTEIDQKEVLTEIIDRKQETILFICSAYDPAILSSRGVIGLKLAELCINERIIFPSLHKRSKSLINILSKYLFFKGLHLPAFYTEKWQNKQTFQNGFSDIFTIFQDYFTPQPSLMSTLEKGKNIREIVKEIEVFAIDYAIKIVGKSQNKIAKHLGISRGSLQHKLKKYEYSNKEWEE
jgi:hypothetical protein